MTFTREEIRFLRLYKTGLITPYKNSKELLFHCDIQAQSINDALFNIKQRISNNDIQRRVDEMKVIRNWTIRNTLHFINIDRYIEVVKINNLLGTWFERIYLKTDKEKASYEKAKSVFKREYLIDKQMLFENGVIKSHITNWQGIFINLTKDGLLLSKDKKYCISTKKNFTNLENITHANISDLAIYYFENYGPATLQDFCYWSGLKVRETQNLVNILALRFKVNTAKLWYSTGDLRLKDKFLKDKIKIPNCLILAKFDPLCLSYKDKSWLSGECFESDIWGRTGIVEAVILNHGEISAIWRKTGKTIYVKPLSKKFNKIDATAKKFLSDNFYEEIIVKEVQNFENI
jgi:hypothetical protein